MNTTKIFYLSILALLTLVSCGTSKRMFHSAAIANPISAPLNSRKKESISQNELQRWSHLDIVKDTIPGMSVDRTYAELLKDKKSSDVIVAILDTGVDINNENLKSIIWTNKKEIPENGIDDDKNGYIDDLHGWSFVGNIGIENHEYDRILVNKNGVDEATYLRAKAAHDNQMEISAKGKAKYVKSLSNINDSDAVIAKFIGKSVYTLEEVNAVVSQDPVVLESKEIIKKILSDGTLVADRKAANQKMIDNYTAYLNGEMTKTNFRAVLGDDPNDINDTKYGNNDVLGNKPYSLHGTQVAGIVSQVSNNQLGVDGVATKVLIMPIRALPKGDEYDKDIALGIRYAVDNGAKIINASFGKAFSPQKQWVYDAIKYAESKDVLIVHAAGNDSKDIDVENNFPNDSDDKKTEFADNLITVGALNYVYSNKLMAYFSNYGKLNVDIFAPGVLIYTSSPKNKYSYSSGTSVAAPNVAGVAALIRSYYPKLTASQVKHVLMDSGVAIPFDVVIGIDPKDIRPFASLSKSGKIVNAFNALLMAEKISKNK